MGGSWSAGTIGEDGDLCKCRVGRIEAPGLLVEVADIARDRADSAPGGGGNDVVA